MPNLYFNIVFGEQVRELLLSVHFVGNCQFLASLCAAGCQHAAAIGCLHAFTEAVLVVSLAVVRLISTFHILIDYILFSNGLPHAAAQCVRRTYGLQI